MAREHIIPECRIERDLLFQVIDYLRDCPHREVDFMLSGLTTLPPVEYVDIKEFAEKIIIALRALGVFGIPAGEDAEEYIRSISAKALDRYNKDDSL